METEKICSGCRKPLPPDVPLGLCPECLIKSGFPTETGAPPAGQGGFVPPSVEEIARLFSQFEVLGFIGKGGMGAVYKARQPALDRFVALKVLPQAVANDPGFAERFNREARALARLSHPNIVGVYDFGKAGALHYLVMEFVDGANLREVERAGKLSPEQALAIVPQICEALQFAHNEGIVHRDIKPENLLLDKKGRLKITDFGIAKMLNAPTDKLSLTGARDVMGTPHYMAPEQIEKPQTVDHRADIYSLGVVFYEMLTGELPLGKFSPPSKKVQVDIRLDDVVLHTLEKEPERRYQQVSQLKTDVETIATTKAPPAVPPLISVQPKVTSDKIILPTFLLALFFGVFGAHRFYVGKIGTGLAQLFTLGGLGVWTTIDWILILCKVFTDSDGRRLTNWWHPGDTYGQAPVSPKRPAKPVGNVSGSSLRLVGPAVALLLAGFIKLFGALKDLFSVHWLGYKLFNNLFFHLGVSHPVAPLLETVLFALLPALVIIFGAVHMIRLSSYPWSIAGAIVAILFCSVIGFPAGIWALSVLTLEDVLATFENPEKRGNTKWPMILGVTGAATLLFSLTFNLPNILPDHRAEILPEMEELQKELNKANAKLAHEQAQFKKGAATALDVKVAKDQKEYVEAERVVELQTPGFRDGQVPFETYSQDLRNAVSAKRSLKSDEDEAQKLDSQMAAVSNTAPLLSTASGTPPFSYRAHFKGTNATPKAMSYDRRHFKGARAAKETNVTASPLLSYQWYMNGSNLWYVDSSNASVGALAQISTSNAVSYNGTMEQNFQTDSVQKPAENSGNSNGNWGLQIQDPPVILNAQPAVNINERVDIGDSPDFSKSFTVEPGGGLTMDVDRGDVTISSADQNDVEIHVTRVVTRAGFSDAATILKNEHVVFDQTGNKISITSQDPRPGLFGFGVNLDVHYEITVPRQFDAHVKTSGGDVKVTGIQGGASVRTMGGNLDCENIDGDVDGQTMGGDVHSVECTGKLRLKTMGGSIGVESFKGPSVQATTEGGSVSADLLVAPESDCKLATSGGNVTVRLPGNAAVTLDAQTEGGSIETDFPLQVAHHFANDSLNGSINGGGPKLQLETAGGNIQVTKQ